MMFRELSFDEAYLYCYDEIMNATESSPMLTRFLISPTRLDINRTIRLDRRINTTDGFWWEECKEEERIVINVNNEPNIEKKIFQNVLFLLEEIKTMMGVLDLIGCV